MTIQEARERGIEIAKGRECKPGAIVCHESNPLAMTLVRYDDETAVCDDVKQGELRFPRAEIFDPKLVVCIGLHMQIFGFWREGMESLVVHL